MASSTTRVVPQILIVAVLIGSFSAEAAHAEDANAPQIELGGEAIIVVPESRKIVLAYSVTKSSWESVTLDSPLEADAKIVTYGGLAAFASKTSVFAYAESTATWGRLDLPKGSTAKFVIDGKIVRVIDGDSLYVFGRNAEEWSGVSLSSGEQIKIE